MICWWTQAILLMSQENALAKNQDGCYLITDHQQLFCLRTRSVREKRDQLPLWMSVINSGPYSSSFSSSFHDYYFSDCRIILSHFHSHDYKYAQLICSFCFDASGPFSRSSRLSARNVKETKEAEPRPRKKHGSKQDEKRRNLNEEIKQGRCGGDKTRAMRRIRTKSRYGKSGGRERGGDAANFGWPARVTEWWLKHHRIWNERRTRGPFNKLMPEPEDKNTRIKGAERERL